MFKLKENTEISVTADKTPLMNFVIFLEMSVC